MGGREREGKTKGGERTDHLWAKMAMGVNLAYGLFCWDCFLLYFVTQIGVPQKPVTHSALGGDPKPPPSELG